MYTFDSRIRYSETDENTYLTIEALIDYFQDCSTFQTEDDGAGLDWLSGQGLAWVLSYWQIDIARLPRLYERVRVGTVPYALKSFMGLRNYFMDALQQEADVPVSGGGKAGNANAGAGAGQQVRERLAVANSVWALMDMEKMAPARITPEHLSRYTLEEKLPMEYLDRKIRLPEGGDVIEAEPVIVNHVHLDTNRHVNNGQYVRIALDALLELWEKIGDTSGIGIGGAGKPFAEGGMRIRVEYKKQAHLGDVLVPVMHVCGEPGKEQTLAVDLQLDGASCCMVAISRI